MNRNKRVAYLIDWPGSSQSGVGRKVLTQVKYWQRYGLDIELIIVTPSKYCEGWAESNLNAKVFGYNGLLERYFSRLRAIQALVISKPDLIYRRYGIFSLEDIFLMPKFPHVLEFNTIDKFENRNRSILIRIWYKLQKKIVINKASGYIGVTNQILENYIDMKFQAGVVIHNSIDFENSLAESKKSNKNPEFIFVGSKNLPWHGVERIFQLAEQLPECNFTIVGGDFTFDRHLANLTFYNELYNDDLLKLLEKSDIGISSLALESINLTEGSPLKTRLYLSHGLPVIGNYTDSAIDVNAEYFLKLPADFESSDPDILRIIRKFVANWSGKRVNKEMVKHLSAEHTEKIRVEFINSLLS